MRSIRVGLEAEKMMQRVAECLYLAIAGPLVEDRVHAGNRGAEQLNA